MEPAKIQSLITMEEILHLYRLVDLVKHDRMIVAEIGAYLGGTTALLLDAVLKYRGFIIAVDSWEDKKILTEFWQNLGELIRRRYILVLHMKSEDAYQIIPDNTLDLIFLDASHLYNDVVNDIKGWLPKVRPEGILCGHDCEKKYMDYSERERKEIDEHSRDDKTPFDCHAGVIKALHDVLDDKYEHQYPSRIWWMVKHA